MNIIVLCKQVPDTESKIKLLESGDGFEQSDIKWVLNPYDEFAVEEALKIKEAGGADKVTVLTAGPARVESAVLSALAMGADDAVILEDDLFDGACAYALAKGLVGALSEMEFGLILCGKQAVDDDMAAVPQMVAQMLDIGQITVVSKVELNGDTLKATREIEGGAKEIIEGQLPLIVTATKGLNEPRYAALPGIMKARRKPKIKKTAADVGVTATDAKTLIVGWSLPSERPPGKIFSGGADELPDNVAKVVALLRDEAKVL